MFEVGEMVGRYVKEIPQQALTSSVPGKHYHMRVSVNEVSTDDEVALAQRIAEGLAEKFDAEVKYIRIENGVIDIQLEGSPFDWVSVAAWLPSVFVLSGIALIGVSVYTVFSAIPSWAWGTLAVGIILLVIAPSIGGWLKPTEE